MMPELSHRAAQLTMIQRSPTDIIVVPNKPAVPSSLLPRFLVSSYRRLYSILRLQFNFPFLPANIDYDTHFKPKYSPWDQRLCLDADGTFCKTLHQQHVRLITGDIESLTNDAIKMRDGQVVLIDIIITATGLRMALGGKVAVSIDGNPVSSQQRYVLNSAMLDKVPNMMLCSAILSIGGL
ncbi:hypothetical protein GGR57DRAFT_306303 [Xylariaceae sp. FL1272]|nr:hypothetical protein GGR57DRAFT_306303 [Xylariaceae sp. FL1272]